jgi:hypothetical protein
MQSVNLPDVMRTGPTPHAHDGAERERTPDVVPMILTDQALGNVVFALRTSLDRVREDDLGSPAARTHWHVARQWLEEAERFRRPGPSIGGGDFVRLKQFPLSGLELRSLQTEVDIAIARRAAHQASLAASAGRHRHIPEAPQQSIWHVRLTSLVLAAALIISLLVNIAWLVLPRLGIIVVPHLSLVLGINSAVTVGTLGVWAAHTVRLRRHSLSLHWHLPPHVTHLPARS